MSPVYIWLMDYDTGRMKRINVQDIEDVYEDQETIENRTYPYTVVSLAFPKGAVFKATESPKEIGRLIREAQKLPDVVNDALEEMRK